jgi:hypothetical protein
MHNFYRMLAAASVLLVFGAIAAFANGQGESSSYSGTIQSIQPAGGSLVGVVLATKKGNYTVDVSQAALTATHLQVGQTITLGGALHQESDGTQVVDPTTIEVGGTTYTIQQNGAQTVVQLASNSGQPEVSHDSGPQGPETTETPETVEPSHPEGSDSQSADPPDAATSR